MKILFLGYAIAEDDVTNLKGASVAGNKMQLNILKNLLKYKNNILKVITIYPTAPYPSGENLFISGKKIKLFDGLKAYRIPFFNVAIIKQLWQVVSVYYQAKKFIINNKDTVIFTFNMFPSIGIPTRLLKNRFGCTVVSLLADLPTDYKKDRKGFDKLLRSLFDKITEKNIKFCDKIISLNKNVMELYAPNIPYIVVEGGIDPSELKKSILNKHNDKVKRILYGGFLTEYNGIKNLVEAIKILNVKDVVLEIYGEGPLVSYLQNVEKSNFQIRYCGTVDNKKMMQLQKEAFLLINPRSTDDLISKVTFPSKIFEYMLSGTPILSTRLNGFTDEYMDKMFFVDSNDSKIMAMKINEILKMKQSELDGIALKAQQFVLKEKSWDKQVEKIQKFLMT